MKRLTTAPLRSEIFNDTDEGARLALGGGVYYLNQREVRTNLHPRREELTRLLRQVEGAPGTESTTDDRSAGTRGRISGKTSAENRDRGRP